MQCVRERDLCGVLGRGTCAVCYGEGLVRCVRERDLCGVLGRGTCAVC